MLYVQFSVCYISSISVTTEAFICNVWNISLLQDSYPAMPDPPWVQEKVIEVQKSLIMCSSLL